jgi:hypothetical protein
VTYGFSFALATLTQNANGTWTIASPGASDTVTSVEVVDFTDRRIALRHAASKAGDFNGDGTSDLLWRHDSGLVGLWTMNGATPQSQQNIAAVGNEWHIAGDGDFNGDGRSDLLWRHDSGLVGLWTMNGAAPQSQQNIAQVGNDWNIID